MNVLQRFAWIFVSPARVFDDIRENRTGWVPAFLVVAVIYLAVTWIGFPIQRALIELNPTRLSAEELARQVETMDRFGLVSQMVFAPAIVLITALVVSGISYVLVTILSRESSFKQYFTLGMYTGIVPAAGYLLTTSLVRLRGVENIVEPDDARFSLSLRALAPEGGAALAGLLGSVEFFAVWGFILLALGLKRVFNMTTGAAVACLVPVWLIYAALAIIGEILGGGVAG